ncbi:MAG: hypothetical protein EBQ89_03070 [Alphaproteobacteria bacterium]|nr:hypothetical protein [Alphaproteobacteria bacterium]
MSEDYLFTPKKDRKSSDTTNKFFCLEQDCDFIDENNLYRKNIDDNTVLAKTINKDNHIIYQIKISNNNELFNPFSKLDREKSYSFLDNVVRPSNKFINTNQSVFNYYLKFLSTKNNAWLVKAERERL